MKPPDCKSDAGVSVTEMTHTGQNHGDTSRVGCRNHLVVTD
jgi:hypothetical protein